MRGKGLTGDINDSVSAAERITKFYWSLHYNEGNSYSVVDEKSVSLNRIKKMLTFLFSFV